MESSQLLSPTGETLAAHSASPSVVSSQAGSGKTSPAPTNGVTSAALTQSADQPATVPMALLVCTTCASTWQNGKRVGISGGEQLLDRLQSRFADEAHGAIALTPTQCMSACSHACVVAFAAPGKHSYLFGDLPHDPAHLDQTVEAIAACADLYVNRPDGLLAWGERPEPLKNGVLARIPPTTVPIA
ncbi:DUF1636 domain-containing protein [Limnothrix sp. FACHB-1088]|uniref:DUF1636 domain-containing protein n=1 Tax=unclassified Limnothrix TaxID=2632864 RepID=UPI00321FF8AB